MNSTESPEKKLETVYKYFSHHIRTNTAVIVAMLEAINEGLTDESMTQMIMESGYLLDIFDRGMSVSFNHIFGKAESSEYEDVDLATLINLFITNAVPKDGSCEAVSSVPDGVKIRCEPYSFKNIIQIYLHEATLAANEGFSVTFIKNELSISPDKGFYDNPSVFAIFEDVLAKHNIETKYDKSSIKLRFPDESINR
ncbi:hypothetical protein Dacet_2703 [Denitrovibrio acetiphilus DSM 12809]|uniref:Uncharacterized protein n=1 Tax=Denitrovibrio acetiphilus (strain DSM 12809 / NBRC 114555 / N2460) TaxID=522772 RepID=D4H5L6_DENA2|nr:hypothetical protein [Denitrovibrio acetiphilus]ADD69457.1 hypothetical protein Dacet_2703 [Denitrovibrio acetiphilus DSM 12809]